MRPRGTRLFSVASGAEKSRKSRTEEKNGKLGSIQGVGVGAASADSSLVGEQASEERERSRVKDRIAAWRSMDKKLNW